MVQIADLSHENFKSSRVMRWWLSRLSSRFGAKSSRERKPKWLPGLSLPNKIVDAESVNTFKTRLDKYWRNQPLLYDFKAELAGTGDRSKCDIEV